MCAKKYNFFYKKDRRVYRRVDLMSIKLSTICFLNQVKRTKTAATLALQSLTSWKSWKNDEKVVILTYTTYIGSLHKFAYLILLDEIFFNTNQLPMSRGDFRTQKIRKIGPTIGQCWVGMVVVLWGMWVSEIWEWFNYSISISHCITQKI